MRQCWCWTGGSGVFEGTLGYCSDSMENCVNFCSSLFPHSHLVWVFISFPFLGVFFFWFFFHFTTMMELVVWFPNSHAFLLLLFLSTDFFVVCDIPSKPVFQSSIQTNSLNVIFYLFLEAYIWLKMGISANEKKKEGACVHEKHLFDE